MVKGFEFLASLIEKRGESINSLAIKLGVTPQAMNNWRVSNEIPTKRVSQLADMFQLTSREIELLLSLDPLNFEYRTKAGADLSGSRVSEYIRVRTETIYERFFSDNDHDHDRDHDNIYDLTNLRKNIEQAGNNHLAIAKFIRSEFTIPDYRPLGDINLGSLVGRLKIKAYFLPFNAIGLIKDGDTIQTAILYKKKNKFVILVDSDRMIDEAHFDRLHEMMHIVFDSVHLKLNVNELESLIDRVCGELIYPQNYIIERFFDGDQNSRPIKNKAVLAEKFWEDSLDQTFALSPKGLAIAIKDCSLANTNTELFKYLVTDLHLEFRKKCISYSKLGDMNFDFSNRVELLKFYNHINSDLKRAKYPLFQKIKNDVLNEYLSVGDFADTFGLKLEDALLIKAVWSNEPSLEQAK